MLTITDNYTGSLPYPLEKLGDPTGLFFFDIETTGLSAKTSQLYLIGCLYTDGTHFQLHQWFAESYADEKLLLTTFRDYVQSLPDGCLLMHFNGNTFDMPYLRQKYERYQQIFPLETMENMDIYRMIRPYKCLLGLPSLRQKAIEDYLGIPRKDPFDGGQLITVYEDYLRTHSSQGLQALLLHNDEDVRNMPLLLAALHFNDYMEAGYQLTQQNIHHTTTWDGSDKTELLLTLISPVALARPISLRLDNGTYLTASGNRIRLAIPLCQLTLKHYFTDTKEYFYLPDEDRAIHKSVGIYVDKEHRQKATKDNCYIKKTSIFIPCPCGMEINEQFHVIFHHQRKEKAFYLEYTSTDPDPLFPGTSQVTADDFWTQYIHAIWKSRR
ncbi:MAG: ribonuclease H-like domain-containing protein [Lachnospiraceae bacterium]|nr:ribonuclease H-like domain-containing protein [Lachnospiraceae bacterium]